MSEQHPRTVAVVVAYNREVLVVEAVAALLAQTVPLHAVLVIDNASTDGTAEAVRHAFPSVELVSLPRNTGGAGGFAVGLASALGRPDVDWIWLMDDDTIPTSSALEELLKAVRVAPPDTSVLGSKVIWTDGREHPMNTPRSNPFVGRSRRAAAERAGMVDVRSTSFVSMLVRADAARRTSLPVADYFIWNDDFEYSARLIRGRRGLAVPRSVVVHKTRVIGSTDADPGERFYYEVRNKLWLMRFSSGLSLVEKAVYSLSTLRRWVRTVARSADRDTLLTGLRAGIRDGFRTRPRPTPEALQGFGSVSDLVRQADGRARS